LHFLLNFIAATIRSCFSPCGNFPIPPPPLNYGHRFRNFGMPANQLPNVLALLSLVLNPLTSSFFTTIVATKYQVLPHAGRARTVQGKTVHVELPLLDCVPFGTQRLVRCSPFSFVPFLLLMCTSRLYRGMNVYCIEVCVDCIEV
jgi:hypothetical protein